MPAVTEEAFLKACPRRGAAWACYRQAKKDGARALLVVDGGEVIVVRTAAPFGIELSKPTKRTAKTLATPP